jgi:FAD-linked oxidoreductase
VGSGHSFTAAAVTQGHLLTLENLTGIISIDRARHLVKVKAGTTLSVLNELLHEEGLALPNLGDIAYQTVAGSISTSTHGTGVTLTGLAGQVRGFTLVNGEGEVLECNGEQNSDIFDLGRVSVGALGVITDYTLQAVPAFRLHAIEKALPLDVVLERIDEFVDSNDHFEFFWLPHTPWALTKRNNRTEEPLQPLPKVRGWIEKTFMENVAFGALCHLGKLRPALIPRLATALPSSGKREYVNDSYKIFASPRIVRFYEMETAIPRAHLVPALKEIRAMIDARGYLLNFPVEVRFTAADDVPLSTAYERESAYIAVHVFKGMEYEPYFKDVEAILKNYGARPHWGKLHFQDSSDLARQYRRFDDFLGLRNRLDPQRVFANAYLTQVFGK